MATTTATQKTIVTVLYPCKHDARFDLDYYLTTHMPLVKQHWQKHGLQSYRVVQMQADAPYSIMAQMEFASGEAFGMAVRDEEAMGEIRADVVRFSSEEPVIVRGEVVGGWVDGGDGR
ncbi:uncharacterized protein EI97DRAFT_429420 [Westerdykella ornata]|uniref:EthD domain-containing protein n=1 Tax=Westerdykella ornata TaxID=318751 RepID=A0A6A6JXM4_WESOR|nr:uncharacterized protein EI97DRAFT_429420 [Westerdykella ornata]KAF2281371.1 hypothetical protein EI97DRAFT_429420 [Westerdykella ornata]